MPDFQKPAVCQVYARGRRLCYVGRMDAVAAHEHVTEAWLFGLDAPFGIATVTGANQACRSAVVPAGLLHRLRVGHGRLAVVYLDPVSDQSGFAAGFADPVIPHPQERLFLDVLHRLTADYPAEGEFWALVECGLSGSRQIDDRLHLVLDMIEQQVDFNLGAAELAESVNLSPSRLIHLSQQQLGVPLRRYRLFERMRRSVLDIHAGKSLTSTALDLGFSTPSHFSASFRNMFGVTPSAALLRQRPVD